MKLVTLTAFWVSTCLGLLFFSLFSLMHYRSDPMDLSFTPGVQAKTISFLDPTSIPFKIIISPAQDIRTMALRKFLQDYKSPLADYVEVLINQADTWGIDYTLIPAIAMQESGGCKKIPSDSYNCWGFGIYGTKITRFNSFPEAIGQVAKTIKEAYIKNGYTNATLVEDKWAPPSRGQWSYSVNFFISKIKEYERNTPAS